MLKTTYLGGFFSSENTDTEKFSYRITHFNALFTDRITKKRIVIG